MSVWFDLSLFPVAQGPSLSRVVLPVVAMIAARGHATAKFDIRSGATGRLAGKVASVDTHPRAASMPCTSETRP